MDLSAFQSMSSTHIALFVGALALTHWAITLVYNIYLHPLAPFAGPRAAALSTSWLHKLSNGGYAEEEFERLHELHGTKALRIAPNELHINETSLYKTIYHGWRPYPKEANFYAGFGVPHSLFTEDNFELHRKRRKMMSPFFAKAGILNFETVIRQHVGRLQAKIERLSAAVSEFAFAQSRSLVEKSDDNFDAPALLVFSAAARSRFDAIYNATARRIAARMPSALIKLMSNEFRLFIEMAEEGKQDYEAYLRNGKKGDGGIFDSLQGLPYDRIVDEAIEVVFAGSDTTAFTLNTGVWHISHSPEIKAALSSTLQIVFPDDSRDTIPSLLQLEAIPYLTACVKESLRIAMPVAGRLPRVVPQPGNGYDPLIIDGQVIPPGTTVSISAYTMHFSQAIWGSDARTFNPDRWLDPSSLNGLTSGLDQYLTTFSKGARNCIGQNLAMAELYMLFYMVFRKFEIRIDER